MTELELLQKVDKALIKLGEKIDAEGRKGEETCKDRAYRQYNKGRAEGIRRAYWTIWFLGKELGYSDRQLGEWEKDDAENNEENAEMTMKLCVRCKYYKCRYKDGCKNCILNKNGQCYCVKQNFDANRCDMFTELTKAKEIKENEK